MSKLWIVGDSYSIGSSYKQNLWQYDENWIDIVSKQLNVQDNDVENFSQFGVSNDYIFKKLIESFYQFQENDYVIIQTTSPSRKWFFVDDPGLSNLTNMRPGAMSKAHDEAVKGYITHLHNVQLDNIQYTAYVYALQYLIISRPDVKFVVVPGFGNFPGVQGNLTDNVCENEFENAKVLDKFYAKTGYDPRLNHMTHVNHKVLANKILSNIENNIPIDLTTGFTSNIYNLNYI